METKMIGTTVRDKKKVGWVRGKKRVNNMVVDIENNKWAWTGHVMRRHLMAPQSNGADSMREEAWQRA